MASLINQTLLSQFRVDAFIAAGGMGAVYRVWDLKRNTPLAMKVLHSELSEDASSFKHFKREANALRQLAHPNIVPFYGLYESGDIVFLLERFIDGPTLKDILRARKDAALSVQEALTYLGALCAALGYAHANGVVHCDVKPANVMLDAGGNIYLTDFGIARHADSSTTTMGAAGTPAYMAPEQILGQEVSPATDVYALGVMLFEMLTGQRPFRGTEAGTEKSGSTANERIRYAHLHVEAPDPHALNKDISPAVAAAVLKALSKNPAERYRSAPDFYAAVQAAAGSMDVPQQVAIAPADDTLVKPRGRELVAPVEPAAEPAVPVEPLPAADATPKRPSRLRTCLLFAGGGLLVAVVLLGGAVLFLGKQLLSGALPPTAAQAGVQAPSAYQAPTSAPPTAVPPTRVPPTSTPYPTYTPYPTQAPVYVPPDTATPAGPMLLLTYNSNCRAGPGDTYSEVNAFLAGQEFPILGQYYQWYLVPINLSWTRVNKCWIYLNLNTIEGDASSIPQIDDPSSVKIHP